MLGARDVDEAHARGERPEEEGTDEGCEPTEPEEDDEHDGQMSHVSRLERRGGVFFDHVEQPAEFREEVDREEYTDAKRGENTHKRTGVEGQCGSHSVSYVCQVFWCQVTVPGSLCQVSVSGLSVVVQC